MLALIDGDLVCYRCAAVNEKADEGLARWQADQMMNRIIEETNASDWRTYITGSNNFRYKLYPEYKANRRDKPKPRHLEALREHLVTDWDATVTDGYEADDALGIGQCTASEPSIICSIDKDLRQISGSHFHFVNREFTKISEVDAIRNFYISMLVGDVADNITGCPGIGTVKGNRALEYAQTSLEMYQIVEKLYTEAKVPREQMILNAQLLYILRREGDSWQPPTLPEAGLKQ